jgi:uncharacterized protein YprB with RNaseH-like and TPR domain
MISGGRTIVCYEGIDAKALLADRAYNANAILEKCAAQRMERIIPVKRKRKERRSHDADLYRLWRLVENAFLNLAGIL